MSTIRAVDGYCPICGEESLRLMAWSAVVECSVCEDPADRLAADRLLQECRHIYHVVCLSPGRMVTLQHPLRERLRGELFSCQFLDVVMASQAFYDPGMYRVFDRGEEGITWIPTQEKQ